jgi:hypothetical protein
MLQQNLDQLKHALQQHGLQVVHAEVHGGDRGRRGEPAAFSDIGPDDEADGGDAGPPRVGTGWVTAQGLDFWA